MDYVDISHTNAGIVLIVQDVYIINNLIYFIIIPHLINKTPSKRQLNKPKYNIVLLTSLFSSHPS